MKKRVQLLVTIILSLVFLPVATVLAVDNDMPVSNTQTTTEQTAEQTVKPEVQEDTTTADYKAKLQERLAKRKEEAKTKLTKAQEKRLTARCKAAQGLIQSISANAKQANTSRSEVYSKVVARMTKLSASLKSQGVDTTKLDADITELTTLVTTFETSMVDLRQSAVDLSGMDCATDPSGFKASLESLRKSRETVAKNSADIRAYIKDTLKPELETIKVGLGGGTQPKTQQEGANQ
jgi:hypothetical protein